MLPQLEGPARTTHFIRRLRGRSQAILALASDGLQWVVKFGENPRGPQVLFSESMGSELYEAAGLPCPLWRPVFIPDSFLDRYPDCWMETSGRRMRPEAGIAFGSLYLGQDEREIFELLPGNRLRTVANASDFWLAWLLDVCACHKDNRQAIFERTRNCAYRAHFIDHGSMFGGPSGRANPGYEGCRYLDKRVYPCISSEVVEYLVRTVLQIDSDRVWATLTHLPSSWKMPEGISQLKECLERLSTPSFIESVALGITQTIEQPDNGENHDLGFEGRISVPVLRPGISASRRR